jgi:hypothetical protein
MVAGENPYGTAGPANLFVSVNPNGLVDPAFGPAQFVASTNVGGFYRPPVQSNRGIDAEFNIAYDNSGGPYTGRVYAVYTDRTTTTSHDSAIYVMSSDADGAVGSWGPPALVNDDVSGNSHFNPAIAIDQSGGTSTSGFVALSWYDCRNSPLNNSAEVWGTVLDGSTDADTGQLIVQPNVPISTGGLINADASDPGFEFGDFDLMDFNNGTFYRSWTDNTLPGHNGLDLATAPVTVTVVCPSPTQHHGLIAAVLADDILAVESTGAGRLTTPVPLATTAGGTAVSTRAAFDEFFARASAVTATGALKGWRPASIPGVAWEDLGWDSSSADACISGLWVGPRFWLRAAEVCRRTG